MRRLSLIIVLFVSVSVSSFAQSVIPDMRVGINTENPSTTLHVEGDLRVRNTSLYSTDFSPLVVDENGLIGTYNGVINNLFYAQSRTRTVFSAADVVDVNASGYVVPWSAADIKYNPSILSLDSDNRTFTLNKKGTFEVSGMVSYNPQALNTSTSVAINVLIQYLPAGTSTWTSIAGTRYFLLVPFMNVAGTINISPAIRNMDVGDKVRILVVKVGGTLHGAAGTPVLEADDFTKMLKIMYL